MTRIIQAVLLFVIGGFLANSAAAQSPSPKPELPELRTELLERLARDQKIRKALLEEGLDAPDRTMLAQMQAIDSANTARMKEIVDEHGFPGSDLVGPDGVNAAFLIIQHADAAFQKRMLPSIKRAYEDGDLEGQSYALLLDRVLVQEGKKQVYGTQIKPVHLWEEGPETYPIRDSAAVDTRRAQVGLPPLDVYMQLMREMYSSQSDQGHD